MGVRRHERDVRAPRLARPPDHLRQARHRRDHAPWFEPNQWIEPVEAFLGEVWAGDAWVEDERDRVLATVLFTDIVGSTARAAELGDRAWRELLQEHHTRVRRQLARFRGREIDTAGDGFFASFDGPARAVRCACATRDAVRDLGIEIRAGLHTGECELLDQKVGGIAVSIGARVAAQAAPGEVLVSSTVWARAAIDSSHVRAFGGAPKPARVPSTAPGAARSTI